MAIVGANNKLCITNLVLNREQNFAPTLSNLGAIREHFAPLLPLILNPGILNNLIDNEHFQKLVIYQLLKYQKIL